MVTNIRSVGWFDHFMQQQREVRTDNARREDSDPWEAKTRIEMGD